MLVLLFIFIQQRSSTIAVENICHLAERTMYVQRISNRVREAERYMRMGESSKHRFNSGVETVKTYICHKIEVYIGSVRFKIDDYSVDFLFSCAPNFCPIDNPSPLDVRFFFRFIETTWPTATLISAEIDWNGCFSRFHFSWAQPFFFYSSRHWLWGEEI